MWVTSEGRAPRMSPCDLPTNLTRARLKGEVVPQPLTRYKRLRKYSRKGWRQKSASTRKSAGEETTRRAEAHRRPWLLCYSVAHVPVVRGSDRHEIIVEFPIPFALVGTLHDLARNDLCALLLRRPLDHRVERNRLAGDFPDHPTPTRWALRWATPGAAGLPHQQCPEPPLGDTDWDQQRKAS